MSRGACTPVCYFLLSLVSIVVLLAGCGTPDLLIVRDQYWKAADFNNEIEKKIEAAVDGYGDTLEYLDIQYPADQAEIALAISEAEPSAAVLSPLFSQFAEEIARQVANCQIVAFGLGSGATTTTENLTILRVDREAAYLRAGDLCRQYLQSPGNEEKGVVGIFYSGGSERTLERNAFIEGIGEGADDRFFLKTFPRLDGIGAVNDYLSELPEKNIGVFFVSMSGLNRDVVSSIVTRYPSLMITERVGSNIDVDIPYSDRILATVEEDWSWIFEERLSDAGPEIVLATSLLPGPAAFSHETSWVGNFFDGSGRE
jgi:hypothetical protein